MVNLAAALEAAVLATRALFQNCEAGRAALKRPCERGSAASDMALARAFTRLVVKWGDADQGRDLFAADFSELGQENDKGQGGADTDAIDADDQLEAAGEIVVFAHGGLQSHQLGVAAALQSLDVAIDLIEDPLVDKVLATVLRRAMSNSISSMKSSARRVRQPGSAVHADHRVAVHSAMRAASMRSFFARRNL